MKILEGHPQKISVGATILILEGGSSARAVVALMIVLLLTGLFAYAVNAQSASLTSRSAANVADAPSPRTTALDDREGSSAPIAYRTQDPQAKLDLRNRGDVQRFARLEGESVELVVGVDASAWQTDNAETVFREEGGEVTGTFSMNDNVQAITVLVEFDRASFFVESLRAKKFVRYVEPNYKVEMCLTPNDPMWPLQWGPAKIEADAAWNTTIGSHNILVAIVDTGIAYMHADLFANYVPYGYDWANNDIDPADDHGHGSHCAGIVAAVLNNGIGIAGIAQISVMAEKVLTRDGSGYDTWVASGIVHATDQGANVISMSFGAYFDSSLVHDAVRYAYNHGVLLVAAAGNEHIDQPFYPAAYDEVIAVAATDSVDQPATFSNYGSWIELAAPGVSIYSTVLDNGYALYSGTSMACPHVSGVAALAWSLYPELTRDQIRELLRYSADDLGTVGFDVQYGHGRVNARKAVMGLQEHDLWISNWQWSKRIDPGQTATFNATIQNRGRHGEADIAVQLIANGSLQEVKTVSSLDVGSHVLVAFLWSAVEMGVYNITCYVLPVPGENFTDNNVVCSEISVRYPTILRVPDDYSSVKEAVNKAGDGDTVLVSEGEYDEGQIEILESNVTLRGEGHVVLSGMNLPNVINIKANFVVVEGFEIQLTVGFAVCIKGTGNSFVGNNVTGRSGIRVDDSAVFNVTQNSMNCSGYGIVVERSCNATIDQNTIISAYSAGVPAEHAQMVTEGLRVSWCSNVTITASNMTEGIKEYGIVITSSQNNTISMNNVSNSIYGLVLSASQSNVLRNNTLAGNRRNFCVFNAHVLDYPSQAVNDVDASNTVEGKPIYFWVGVNDSIIPSDAGCVVLVYCKRIVIENLTLKNNFNSILLMDTDDVTIRGINFTDDYGMADLPSKEWDLSAPVLGLFDSSNITVDSNYVECFHRYGIYFVGGSSNSITRNTVVGYTNGYGIRLTSSYSVVSGNNLTRCFNSIRTDGGSNVTISFNTVVSGNAEGIYLYGYGHTVTMNNVSGCYTGIRIAEGPCIVSYNTVADTRYGVWMEGWSNTFYRNNFINNRQQVFFSSTEYVNYWNISYPVGGNYWENYTGVDEKSGPDQDQRGSDGIGDTPLSFAANNTDYYPLMKPWICGQTHDVAVSSVQPIRTIVGEGYTARVKFNVTDQGDSSETLTVRLYFNGSEVDSRIIILESGNVVMEFTLNSTGFPRGNFTLCAVADVVQNETDTTDNVAVGWIVVTVAGDVTSTTQGIPDYRVDMRDVGAVVKAFMATSSSPTWDPNCDINDDGVINMRDVGISCSNFGKQ